MVWLAFKMSMCLESKMYGFVILASLLIHTLTYIYHSDALLTIPRLMLLTSSAVTLHIFVLHKKFCSSLRLDILFTIIPQAVVTKSSVPDAFCSCSFNENLTWNAQSSSVVYLRRTSFCSTFLLIPNRFCDSFELHCWCPQDETGSLILGIVVTQSSQWCSSLLTVLLVPLNNLQVTIIFSWRLLFCHS